MKRMAIALSSILVLALLAGCGSISLGDGQTLNLSEDGISVTGPDGQSSLKIDGGEDGIKISVTDEAGETMEQTIKTELPAAFPSEIPIPDEAYDIVSIDSSDASVNIIVSYKMKATVHEYYNVYRAYMTGAGFELVADASQGKADPDTKLENFLGKRGDETLSIGVMVSGTGQYDDGSISVQIMYMKD